MKFLIDENLPISLKKKLSEKGYDVFDIRELGKFGITDEEIIKIASDQGRILISANYKHFGNIIMFPPSQYNGIIIVKMPKSSIQEVIKRVINVIDSLSEEDIKNSTIIIEPSKLRKRK
jgi:predicted nuclease of predicted toxin-antitoxin system